MQIKSVCARACVCVWEREQEKERNWRVEIEKREQQKEGKREIIFPVSSNSLEEKKLGIFGMCQSRGRVNKGNRVIVRGRNDE